MKVVAIGDNCLDWYLDRDQVHPGGNALNVSVYCRQLGADSAYIGQFGTDWAGDIMLGALTAEGVDITRTRRVEGTSGYATVENVDGERVFRGSSKGVVAFEPDAADFTFMAGADVIHTGDSSFMEGSVAKFAGIAPLSYDFSTKSDAYCEPILPAVTYATFSRPDLSQAEVKDLIEWAHGLGAKEVYVTQGVAGSYSSSGSKIHYQPASSVAAVVDTLGAGDSFIAGILIARLGGSSLHEAAASASAWAAASCASVGAFGHGESAAGMTVSHDHQFAS